MFESEHEGSLYILLRLFKLSYACDRFKARVCVVAILTLTLAMSTLPTESLPINNAEDFKSTQQSALDGSPQNHNGQQLENLLHPPPPFRKYTRQQLVHLSTSPLVKPPPNMPELKVWFG